MQQTSDDSRQDILAQARFRRVRNGRVMVVTGAGLVGVGRDDADALFDAMLNGLEDYMVRQRALHPEAA